MSLPLAPAAAAVVAATLVPPDGRAAGGWFAFDGGTPRQQAEASRFAGRFRRLVSSLVEAHARRGGR